MRLCFAQFQHHAPARGGECAARLPALGSETGGKNALAAIGKSWPLGAKFSENLLDATNALSIAIEEKRTGIPQTVRPRCGAKGRSPGDPNRVEFTLHMPSLSPVQYAEDRELRETLYRASATRA
jgi:Zn-dependent oligopeptidase